MARRETAEREAEARIAFLQGLLQVGSADVASPARLAEADFLVGLGWASNLPRPRSARRRIALVTGHDDDIGTRLDALLRSAGLAPDRVGDPDDGRTARSLRILPDRLNERVAAALTARHSKLAPRLSELEVMGVREVVADGTVRVRGSSLALGGLDLDPVLAALGEVGLPLRRLRDAMARGTRLDTRHRRVLLVENEGVFAEVALDDALIVMMPGVNTLGATTLLEALPAGMAVLHFGDLDTRGMEAAARTRAAAIAAGHRHAWFVPAWVGEYTPAQGLHRWPGAPLPDWADHTAIRMLRVRERWIEQEAFVLDERMPRVLEEAFRSIED